ncbi:MAG: LapA family protein [Gemmatimonadota bacterium]|nr:LapA family protein [Gemmatimonadota bacterium]MDH3426888.1 LapA family protein [Gemmatimonadota bacterium]
MDVKNLWQGIKQILLVMLGGLVVLFAFVNLEAVPINLLFTDLQVSLSLLILISAFAGVLIGWTGGALRGRRKRRALAAGQRAQLQASAEDEQWLAEGVEEEAAPRPSK